VLKNRWGQWTVIAATVVVLVVALRTCGSGSDLANRDPGQKIDAELTLQTVTLEQPDENGKLLWRLKAESVVYSPDNQRAELQGLKGEFFQESQTIYTVVADEGEVQQNGETLFLRGNLVATGTENKLTLKGEKLKWQPKQDLLMMGNFEDDAALVGLDGKPAKAPTAENSSTEAAPQTTAQTSQPDAKPNVQADSQPKAAPVVGFNPQIEAVAQVVKVYNQENRVELAGEVAAKSKATPWLAFQSENLLWFTERQLIEAD
jgi:LPS export ABC transporter protein LptC